jgi:D-sedoheptulose 7-phosphate isomerase
MSKRSDEIADLIGGSAAALAALKDQADTIAQIADVIVEALRAGGALLLCGNGGSAAQCQHIATEFTGRFKLERCGYRAISLTTDTSALTAIGNDYGFDQVFARQVEALARPGDVLLGLSTSGNSANVLNAFNTARQTGVKTIALVGSSGGAIADAADVVLAAPGNASAVIQECHIAALHAICDVAERELSGEDNR